MSALLFISGAALGVAAYRAWRDSMENVALLNAAKQRDELLAEIKRLRIQVSLHIGTK